MRRGLIALLAAGAMLAPAAASAQQSQAGETWRPDIRAARDYARKRLGHVSFAVRTPRRGYGFRSRTTARSASVVKAMLMVAYLNHPSVRGRDLRRGDRALLAPMIRWSSNAAATRVRDFVGNAALERLARRARMPRFRAMPIWGDSVITAGDQSRFFLRIDRLTVARHRAHALRLLNTVVNSQRWGIARARPGAWALYFKGGWGSGTGAVDHQVALLRRSERRISVAILTTGNPSHAYGKDTLRGVARRLLRGLRADSAPR